MKKHYAWKPLHVNFCCRYAADLLQIFTLDFNGEVKIHDHSAMKVYCCRFCCGNDAHFEYIDFLSLNISIIRSKIRTICYGFVAVDLLAEMLQICGQSAAFLSHVQGHLNCKLKKIKQKEDIMLSWLYNNFSYLNLVFLYK